jgi:ABC-2 type transport system permease protein
MRPMHASTPAVAWSIARRSLMLIPRVPSTFFPSLVMPVFLTVSFAGQFAGIALLPGFPTDQILNWFLPMATVQGAAFAGITTGLGVARDLEGGFFDRLLLSSAHRSALVAGPLLAGMLRALLPVTLLTIVALVSDASFVGGFMGWITLVVACLGVALAAGAYAFGLAVRFKTMQVAPLMQIGVFTTVFLSAAQMPLDLLTGWLHRVASINPMTEVLGLAREGFLGEVTWSGTWPGLIALAGMAAVLVIFAARSMQRAFSF